MVFVLLDLETAGEKIGIVQLLPEILCLDTVCNKSNTRKKKGEINVGADTANMFCRNSDVFDKYVKSSEDEAGAHDLSWYII